MLVLGIDPGTALTGYGLVRQDAAGKLQLVDFGAISTPARLPMAERLRRLHQELTDIIQLHQPEIGAVEKLFYQRNVSTAISVGQGRGVAILALAQAGVKVDEYTPGEVKQAVCGYGGADKVQVQRMVQALLEMNELPQPDDAADALAVAICCLHSQQTRRRIEEGM